MGCRFDTYIEETLFCCCFGGAGGGGGECIILDFKMLSQSEIMF